MVQVLTYFVSTSAALLDNINSTSQQNVYYGVSLQITGSSFGISGNRINLLSGSKLIASFPYDQTDLFIDSSSASFPTFSVNNDPILQYYIIPTNISPNTSSYFKIINSSSLAELVNISINNIASQGNIQVPSASTYTISYNTGMAYDSYNTLTITNSSGSVLYSTSSFNKSSSINLTPTSSTFYNIELSTNYSSYIILTYDDPGDIPVSPTNSISEWNTYLNINATSTFSSASTITLLGDGLFYQENLTVPSGEKLNTLQFYKTQYLSSCFASGSALTTIPSTQNSPNLGYLDVSYNDLSGSFPNLSTSPFVVLIANHNSFSSYTQGSGYVVSPSMSYIDLSYNALPTASIDGILFDLAFSSSITSGTLNLTGSGNSGPSTGAGSDYYLILQNVKGWTIYANPFGT